jgi:hypothetical protein
VLTLAIGYGAKFLTDFIQERLVAKRDRVNRESEKKEKARDRRRGFQHQTLLELQEEVMRLARATGAANHQDHTAWRETGEWQKRLLSDHVDENFRLSQARTWLLAVRIRDGLARDLTEKFKDCCTQAVTSASKEGSDRAIANMMGALDALNKRVGELLRELDAEVDETLSR